VKKLFLLIILCVLFFVSLGWWFGLYRSVESMYYGTKYKVSDCVSDALGNIARFDSISEQNGELVYITSMQKVASANFMLIQTIIMYKNKIPLSVPKIDSNFDIKLTSCPEK